mgnify:CR=1 FL=1
MKECKECAYCNGFDYEDGMPYCKYDGGEGNCPYNDDAPTKESEDKTQIVIDVKYMTEYVRHTLKNTFEKEAYSIAEKEISKIVKDRYEEIIEKITEDRVTELVKTQVDEFMAGEIHIGGGWHEEARTLTRTEYMAELVEKTMQKMADDKHLVQYAKDAAEKAINDFTVRMKNDINAGIKKNFDEATRRTLTDSVVAMLMTSETYQGLASASQRMLK